jgi:hypothetical protein
MDDEGGSVCEEQDSEKTVQNLAEMEIGAQTKDRCGRRPATSYGLR